MALTTRKRPPAHLHRKRTGTHRSHGKHYLKPYWPYLPLLMIVLVGLAINAAWSAPKGVLGYATDMSAQTLLADTNVQRSEHRETGLTLNSELMQAAQTKANDMAARNYWSHDTPDGRTPWSFITATGYQYQKAGENLAYGFSSAGTTITGWMNSPEHRANILNGSYSQVGFGVVDVPNYQSSGPETLVVAMYAQPASISTAAAALPGNFSQTSPVTSSAPTAPATQRVARVQLLTAGSAPWSLFAVSALASLAVIIFLLRHALFWQRALAKSEAFVIHHPRIDMAVVTIAMAGIVLSHSVGVIR